MSKRKALIVEDNEQNLYLASFLLTHGGFEVIAAHDGIEAIRHVKESNPDVILLDIQLPGMDGFEVLHIIQNTPSFSQIPVIAVTSHAMPGDRERMLAAGCIDHIEKPINPDDFVTRVANNMAGNN